MALSVFRPTVKRKDMGSVLSCIVSDRIGPGEISRDLVSRLCHHLGHAGGVTLASSYLAVSAALEALQLPPSAGVVLSALSPAAWLRVLRDRGLEPMVADVDAESGSIDPNQVSMLVQKGARAVMVHHTLGIVADVETLKTHGLPVVEDASQALGGRTGDAPCGGSADFCLLSMEPEHIITCGGGALVLGRSRNAAAALKRIQEANPLYAPLADMNAALGVSQAAALEIFAAARREIAEAYRQALMKGRHRSLALPTEAEVVLSSFPVVLGSGMKEARAYALKKGIDTLPAFAQSIAALEEPPMAAHCPHARTLALRCLLVPLYPMLGKRDVEAVCRVLSTLP